MLRVLSPRLCAVPACDRKLYARGWCTLHYQRERTRGGLDTPPVLTAAQRLTSGLVRMPNGCLEWTRSKDGHGYGQIRIAGKTVNTHRFAWAQANGSIPEGMEVCHHCDNPPCCDLEHLFLGTQAENLADMTAKGRRGVRGGARQLLVRCKRGHPYDDANTYTNPSGYRECRECRAQRRTR